MIIEVDNKKFYLTDDQVRKIDEKHNSVLIPCNKLDRAAKRLSCEQIGKLIMLLREYIREWVVPEIDDPELEYPFEDFKDSIDYNRKTYIEKSVKASAISRKSKIYKEITEEEETQIQELEKRVKELEAEKLAQQITIVNERPRVSTDVDERPRVSTDVHLYDNDNENKFDNEKDTEKDSKGETFVKREALSNILGLLLDGKNLIQSQRNKLYLSIESDYNNGRVYTVDELNNIIDNAESAF